jgi:hypothetical protein
MEEVGREVPEEELLMFLASGPGEGDLCGKSGALFTPLVLALCYSAHSLINRLPGLHTAGLYSPGRFIGSSVQEFGILCPRVAVTL